MLQCKVYFKIYFLGAIDGKHCEIQSFGKSGSLFYNYKGKFSIILFALVDANYRFMFVEVGKPGSINDASVWQVGISTWNTIAANYVRTIVVLIFKLSQLYILSIMQRLHSLERCISWFQVTKLIV